MAHQHEDSPPNIPARSYGSRVIDDVSTLCMAARMARAKRATQLFAPKTWTCFICNNASPLGSNCQFCSACACFNCGEIGKPEETAGGDELCAGCIQNKAEAAAERQYEADCEAFYGGDRPFTMAEKMACEEQL